MKIKRRHLTGGCRHEQRGFATLVVLVFLTIMTVYVVGNNLVLNHLNQDLRLVEKRQLRKYHEPVNKASVAGVISNQWPAVVQGTRLTQ